MTTSHANIKRIYLYTFFYMFLVIVPVMVPYFASLGLSMTEILTIQGVFGISMALFEVPSGYIGDLWGRKNVLVLGSFIAGISFSLLLLARDFWGILFYEVLSGIGASLVSGADLSILYDSEDSSGRTKQQSLANFYGLQLIGEALAALTCSFLMVYSYQYVLWAQFLVGWIPFFVSLFLVSPDIEGMKKTQHMENIKEVLSYIFKDNKFIRFIFINMVLVSLGTFTAIWPIQKYWQDQGVPLYKLGYLWAACNLIAAGTGKIAPWLELKLGSKNLMISLCLLCVGGYFGMGFSTSAISILLPFLFYICRGLNMVILREAFNQRIPAKFRNTANSLSSLCLRVAFFVIAPIIGLSIEHYGLDWTFIFLGTFFLLLFFIFMTPLYKRL